MSKIDRTGEERINTFGSKMIIKEYRGCMDVDVYFPEFNWTVKHAKYNNFKKGKIKCPYERRHHGVGYIGEGKCKTWENGKQTKCYKVWCSMLERCYDEKHREKYPTYEGCKIYDKWLNFQNFAEWYYNNYYEVDDERMHLDKDILVKGNKIYSPDNCIFVPERINTLFTKSNKCRGEYPIGVNYYKQNRKFISQCNIYDFEENKTKKIHLGCYNTPEEAFKVYKEFKESYIKQVADYYKGRIPLRLYDAMYNYEVEITD